MKYIIRGLWNYYIGQDSTHSYLPSRDLVFCPFDRLEHSFRYYTGSVGESLTLLGQTRGESYYYMYYRLPYIVDATLTTTRNLFHSSDNGGYGEQRYKIPFTVQDAGNEFVIDSTFIFNFTAPSTLTYSLTTNSATNNKPLKGLAINLQQGDVIDIFSNYDVKIESIDAFDFIPTPYLRDGSQGVATPENGFEIVSETESTTTIRYRPSKFYQKYSDSSGYLAINQIALAGTLTNLRYFNYDHIEFSYDSQRGFGSIDVAYY